jgi:hypothetical protein
MNIGAGIGIGFAEPRGVLAFEYEQSSGCQNGSDITPVINTPGGTFSASPAGLSIDASTGVIDVSASTAGTYTVTYSIGPTEDTITIQAADDATFSYSASSFPQDGSNPIPTVTGVTGGTFSAGSGLVFVDSGSNTGSSTGQIDLSASTIASYTITYTTAGSCPNSSTQTVEVASAVAISYSSSEFCEDASNPTPTVTGNVGAGTFSSTAGLVFISTTTGVIDISASTPSATPYVITYTDTNSATATFSLTINALDDAGFSYSASIFAQNFPDPTPTITGLTGGTFSGSTGLVINSTTGVIDLDASTIASHTITYDTTSSGSSVCPNTSTQTINIVAELAQVSNVYSMEFDGTNDFININSLASSLGSQGSFSAWVNVSDWSTRAAILAFAFDADNFLRFGVRPDNNNCFSIGGQFNNVSNEVLSDTTSLSENVWYHIVATSNGSVYNLYVNGQLQTLTILAGSNNGDWVSDFSSTANKGTIGSLNRTGPSEDLFNGKLDEVAVFNTALTAQEVKSIYLATEIVSGASKTADLNDLTTPPVKWYRMGD